MRCVAVLRKDDISIGAEDRWWCFDARSAMGERERGERHVEPTFDPRRPVVMVGDPAGGKLRIANCLRHVTHACGGYVTCLKECFPLSSRSRFENVSQYRGFAVAVLLALFVALLDH